MRVNVYVQFGLAMCGIVLLSLIGTAYLAASFNRRAKSDLFEALRPLADRIDGDVNLEDAEVSGRYAGHLAFGRMANATGGPGRVFQSELVDSAGGAEWRYTSDPPRRGAATPRQQFETSDPRLRSGLSPDWTGLARRAIDPATDRYRVEYDPSSGLLRFIRPMRTRRDIPTSDEFAGHLDLLVALGPINRHAQEAPNADWAGGRRASDPDTRSGLE